jgi:hypothetical protein
LLYSSRALDAQPEMALKHKVTSHLAPILSTLGGRFSPIRSKCLLLSFSCLLMPTHVY